jgi:ribosome-associated toxin RatA of RatAB toxin-antitoxin module
METVTVHAVVDGTEPAEVFERVVEFERYPELVETVKALTVDRSSDPDAPASSWEVYFRNGILRWDEIDELDRERLTVTFNQTEGDFDVFRGDWRLRPEAEGTDVVFTGSFDFGVPSLASIIDPVAVRVLSETIVTTMQGLFGGRTRIVDVDSTLGVSR